jgi:hypothetical protein
VIAPTLSSSLFSAGFDLLPFLYSSFRFVEGMIGNLVTLPSKILPIYRHTKFTTTNL